MTTAASTPQLSSGRTLSESRFARLVTLSALYLAQGVPWGFITVGYIVLLADQGVDNATIGDALALAYVPWSFKILAGPLLDRVASTPFGRRRPFIVVAQLLMGLSLLALLFVDAKSQLALVGAIFFLHNSFAALQDVATDALAVDVLPEDERGKANSFMWASKHAGIAVGGGGGLIVAKHFGWSALFVLNALVIWAVMALVIVIRERPKEADGVAAAPAKRLDWAEIRRSFGFAAPLLGIAVALFTPAGYGLTGAVLLRLMRVDLQLSDEKIAVLSGTVGPIAGVGGALVGGFIADKVGVRKTMGALMAIVGIALAVFAASSQLWPHMGFLVGFTIVASGAFSAFSAASLGFFMTLSNPAIGATQFALYMALANVTYGWASSVGGRLADRHGPKTTFAIAAALQIAAIGLLFLVNPKTAEARFRGQRKADADAETAATAAVTRAEVAEAAEVSPSAMP